MVQIIGAYKLERNENLDEFYEKMGGNYVEGDTNLLMSRLGVPWMARKMMCTSTPTITVTKDEEETWVFKTVTFFRTIEISFKLEEEYEETMPSGNTYESTTSMSGENLFITKSKSGEDVAFERHYEFTDDGMIMTMKSQTTDVVAKRYFKRLQ